MTEKVARESEDMTDTDLERLRNAFPQFVKEDVIDFDALKAFFDAEGMLAGTEKYGLSWAGKSDAFRAIRTNATGTLAPQPEESKAFDATENVFIEGDNLEVLKLLQKHYRETVKMIYIDPPYNTGHDFVYKDNFTENVADYYERTGQTEGGIRMTANTEKNGRYHSDWLTMMYPRLFLAKNLLRPDGVIFVSIDDNEVANLRLVMDEIFGEENFVTDIIWEKRFTRSNNAKMFASLIEHILLYRKSETLQDLKEPRSEKADSTYSNPDNDSRGVWTSVSYVNPAIKEQRPNLSYPLVNPITKKEVTHPTNAWKFSRNVYELHVAESRLYWGKDGGHTYPRLKVFLSEMEGGMVPVDLWKHETTGTTDDASKNLQELLDGKFFDFPKPVGLIQRMLRLATSNDDLILDFFAGSGTTAHAVMDLNAEDGGNRKWICVQLPEVTSEESEAYKAGYKTIADISRERIRRAGEKIKKRCHAELVSASQKDKEIPKRVRDDKVEGCEKLDLDAGFKSYKLALSNYRQWRELTADDTPEELLKQSKLFIEHPLVNGFDERAVVYEILFKEGFDLNAQVTSPAPLPEGSSRVREGEGWEGVWTITEGDSSTSSEQEKKLVVTFADKVTQADVESLGLKSEDTFVCLDSALDDTTKVNIARSVNLKVI